MILARLLIGGTLAVVIFGTHWVALAMMPLYTSENDIVLSEPRWGLWTVVIMLPEAVLAVGLLAVLSAASARVDAEVVWTIWLGFSFVALLGVGVACFALSQDSDRFQYIEGLWPW